MKTVRLLRGSLARTPRFTLLLASITVFAPIAARAQGSLRVPDPADTLRALEMSDATRGAYSPEYSEINRVAERHYPPALRTAGVGGTVLLRLVVDAHGRALAPRVAESSGNAELDAAALRVARELRYTPAIRNGTPHPVWAFFTVRFRAPGRDWVEGATAQQVRAWADSAQALAPSQVDQGPNSLNLSGRMVEEAYPPALRDAGVRGTVGIWIAVDDRGTPSAVRVAQSSGHPELDRVARQLAEKLRFNPARRAGQPVNAWVVYYLPFHPPAFAANWLLPDGGIAPLPESEPEVVDPASVDTTAVYDVGRLTVQPQLVNRSEVARALVQNYPSALREQGVTGGATVWTVIGRDGRVEIARASGGTRLGFEPAAEAVVRTMRFRPGTVANVPVRVQVVLPVTFSLEREE
jgi:TonB family protein